MKNRRAGSFSVERLETRQMLSVQPLLNLATKTGSSTPTEIASFQGQVLFSAQGALGREPWITDGTAQGTRLLKDIQPGTNSSAPTGFFPLGNKAFFMASAPGVGKELFVTDGSSQNTTLVADLAPGTASPLLSQFVGYNNKLYFMLSNSLWESDGTSLGTKKIWTNAANLIKPVVFKNELYFVSVETGGSQRLRAVNVDSNVRLVSNVNVVQQELSSSPLVVMGNSLFFTADGGAGFELYVTDGTTTTQFMDLNPGSGSSTPFPMGATNGKLYFTAKLTGTLLGTLFVTDGTIAGTQQLPNTFNSSSGGPNNFGTWNGLLFFGASDSGGLEPWVSDGTPAGTKRLADIRTGSSGSNPLMFQVNDNRMYFAASPTSSTSRWYVTDGTAAGTQWFNHLYQPNSPKVPGGKVIASYTDEILGAEPAAIDAVTDDASVIKDIQIASVAPTVSAFAEAGGLVYFSVDGKLMRTDGTATGTISLGASGTFVTAKVGPDGRTYILANNLLLVTDGTVQGTSQLTTFGGAASNMLFLGNQVIILSFIVSNRSSLLGVNRTTGQTTQLGDLWPLSGANMEGIANGRVFITGLNDGHSTIYQSDGTVAGTNKLEFMLDNYGTSYRAVGSTPTTTYMKLGAAANSLYRVDGTQAGSYIVLNPLTSFGGGIEYNNQLILFASNSIFRSGLTDTSLIKVADFAQSMPMYDLTKARAAGTNLGLFFIASDGSPSAAGLWKTDTTGANPALVTSLPMPLSGVGTPLRLLGTTQHLYFDDGTNVYVSDGSAAGPTMIVGLSQSGYSASRAGLGDSLITVETQGEYRLLRVSEDPSSSIAGSVFLDINGDATQSGNEDSLGARNVYLDLNNNGSLDANEPQQATNAVNGFVFGGLSPGQYYVCPVLSAQETQTTPALPITVAPGQSATTTIGVRAVDTQGPTTVFSSFDIDGSSVQIQFDEDIAVAGGASFELKNIDTDTSIQMPAAAAVVDNDWNRITINLPLTTLAKGNYQLIVSSGDVQDMSGNSPATATLVGFGFLPADATLNRLVDTQDFNLLAAHFGTAGKKFTQGNFSFDATGVVDSVDFDILVAAYGDRLPPQSLSSIVMSPTPSLFGSSGIHGNEEDSRLLV